MRADDPRDVLAAVRRMEGDLARVRASAEPEPAPVDDVARLREEIEIDAARERVALVQDLELLLEVMEAGWRRTNADINRLAGEIAELRQMISETAEMLSGARLEVRLTSDAGADSQGHAAHPANGRTGGEPAHAGATNGASAH